MSPLWLRYAQGAEEALRLMRQRAIIHALPERVLPLPFCLARLVDCGG